jgi:hypothetical protein
MPSEKFQGACGNQYMAKNSWRIDVVFIHEALGLI